MIGFYVLLYVLSGNTNFEGLTFLPNRCQKEHNSKPFPLNTLLPYNVEYEIQPTWKQDTGTL